MNSVENAVNENTKEAIEYELGCEHEIRYYLKQIKFAMSDVEDDTKHTKFVPTYFITAVKLPTGAIELAVNTSNIAEKIDYVLNAYDDMMRLKSNKEISMVQLMVV